MKCLKIRQNGVGGGGGCVKVCVGGREVRSNPYKRQTYKSATSGKTNYRHELEF